MAGAPPRARAFHLFALALAFAFAFAPAGPEHPGGGAQGGWTPLQLSRRPGQRYHTAPANYPARSRCRGPHGDRHVLREQPERELHARPETEDRLQEAAARTVGRGDPELYDGADDVPR